ncbi:Pentapeptide repeat protein [Trichormus variabilis ATCC 29413]|uniref:Pentapeptide repeat protein n=2 Tax=Anabaena variabilis TaxID=264691 RepID=Q3M4U0_TRIV2|nr:MULTISPECIES: pentapeptide repeat-containing protein [Nostocaceae]ABA23996.1 Pentapeptide repeat protein [Trichormus variabilis ATCC 29413]MBC1216037.1 pentapeptide repeat-containing protein [Trichormus variabilis ARAD]MBC1253879.1 pentapeptide repeat-containing protein [Trichormus variabilis V5]MBC1267948.1 pentapeptide repeat-containing protein [Trichormus variabilis FSR]MBC1304560.1 pentapeptide repeat-containing protein [Trichormus variabilis N2B]
MNVEELLAQYATGVINFSGVDLSEANLSGVKLCGVNFSQANLSIANLSGSNLSEADFSHAKLNVARLSGANLTNAIFNHSSLNVANLIRSDLSRAQLRGASLVRAELIRAELSRVDLSEANLNSADLREATLRHANLRHANLNGASLKGASLVGANLEMANLNGSDLSRCDLTSANLRDAELKQVNFRHANLSGADLSGANLRWADLSGVNLSWADLSNAKLSGANLVGADLSNANLTNASLVHANLIQAKLIRAEWVGADLTSAILTGAKLYSTSRFGLKTEGLICQWIDLSPTGDRSIIQRFDTEDPREFFNETPPTIQIVIDAALEAEANFALAGAYYHIAQEYSILKQPPSMEISRRRTVFTFRVDNDADLLPTACMAILPFKDAVNTQKNIYALLAMMEQENISSLGIKTPHRVKELTSAIAEAISQAQTMKKTKKNLHLAAKIEFFQAPTQTILTNSSAQTLIVHDSPNFGKRFINSSITEMTFSSDVSGESLPHNLPGLNTLTDFVNSFHYVNE